MLIEGFDGVTNTAYPIAIAGIITDPTTGKKYALLQSSVSQNGVWTINQGGVWTVQPGNTPNTTPWLFAQSNNNANIPAGAGTTIVKATPGQLTTIVILTTGTAVLQIFDNASAGSGQLLWQSVGAPQQGTVVNIFGRANNGITALGIAGSPQAIVYFD